MNFREISMSENIKLNMIKTCSLFGKSKQSFYRYKNYQLQKQSFEHKVVSTVKQIRAEVGECGARKLQVYLHNKGIDIGRDKLFDLLRENCLQAKCYRKRINTSDGKKSIYPNLLKQYDKVIKPGNILVSDITYIKIRTGHVYLSLTNDLHSNKILGYSLEKDLGTQGPIKSLQMALKHSNSESVKMHHSDKGSQYTSNMFRSKLRKNNIDISMTGAGKCYDNAVAERINGVLKTELGLNKIFANFNEALIYVKSTIDIYNRLRIIGVKGYKTPIEIYREAKHCG